MDAVDMLIAGLDTYGYITTINPSGFAYVFNKQEQVLMRISCDGKDVNPCLVNSAANIKDIFNISQELERFRKEGWINISTEQMVYDKISKKVLYGLEAKQFQMLEDLRTPESSDSYN